MVRESKLQKPVKATMRKPAPKKCPRCGAIYQMGIMHDCLPQNTRKA